ncbi:hypothetical protein AB3X86_11605 [Paraburkholderia sp. BR14374]
MRKEKTRGSKEAARDRECRRCQMPAAGFGAHARSAIQEAAIVAASRWRRESPPDGNFVDLASAFFSCDKR